MDSASVIERLEADYQALADEFERRFGREYVIEETPFDRTQYPCRACRRLREPVEWCPDCCSAFRQAHHEIALELFWRDRQQAEIRAAPLAQRAQLSRLAAREADWDARDRFFPAWQQLPQVTSTVKRIGRFIQTTDQENAYLARARKMLLSDAPLPPIRYRPPPTPVDEWRPVPPGHTPEGGEFRHYVRRDEAYTERLKEDIAVLRTKLVRP